MSEFIHFARPSGKEVRVRAADVVLIDMDAGKRPGDIRACSRLHLRGSAPSFAVVGAPEAVQERIEQAMKRERGETTTQPPAPGIECDPFTELIATPADVIILHDTDGFPAMLRASRIAAAIRPMGTGNRYAKVIMDMGDAGDPLTLEVREDVYDIAELLGWTPPVVAESASAPASSHVDGYGQDEPDTEAPADA